MKRILAFTLVMLLAVCLALPCFAAEITDISETPEQQAKGKYHAAKIKLYTEEVKGEDTTVTLPDGTGITVELDEKYIGYTLVIQPITQAEKEAYDWIKGCVPKNIKKFSAYDIYLLSTEDERVALPDNTPIEIVVIDSSNCVLGLTYEGKTSSISSTQKGKKISFKSSAKAGYYLICQKSSSGGDAPQTSDPLGMQVAIVGLATVALIAVALTKKRRSAER